MSKVTIGSKQISESKLKNVQSTLDGLKSILSEVAYQDRVKEFAMYLNLDAVEFSNYIANNKNSTGVNAITANYRARLNKIVSQWCYMFNKLLHLDMTDNDMSAFYELSVDMVQTASNIPDDTQTASMLALCVKRGEFDVLAFSKKWGTQISNRTSYQFGNGVGIAPTAKNNVEFYSPLSTETVPIGEAEKQPDKQVSPVIKPSSKIQKKH